MCKDIESIKFSIKELKNYKVSVKDSKFIVTLFYSDEKVVIEKFCENIEDYYHWQMYYIKNSGWISFYHHNSVLDFKPPNKNKATSNKSNEYPKKNQYMSIDATVLSDKEIRNIMD